MESCTRCFLGVLGFEAMRQLSFKGALLLVLIGALACTKSTETAEEPKPSAAVDPNAQAAANLAAYDETTGERTMDERAKRDEMKNLLKKPVFRNKFLGISTLQNPSDAWILMEIFWDVKPDLIVEAGTYHGGSAVLWAIILEHINPDAQIITIDVEDQREPGAKTIAIAQERVTFLLGSSTAPDVVAEVQRRAKGKRVMVLLDSLHSKEHVAAELAAYSPLVPVGSYIVVQDTPLDSLAAIDEFLEANKNFTADRWRERYADTNSVRGYLRRMR
jgi:cephalosporin hydroxylase